MCSGNVVWNDDAKGDRKGRAKLVGLPDGLLVEGLGFVERSI